MIEVKTDEFGDLDGDVGARGIQVTVCEFRVG